MLDPFFIQRKVKLIQEDLENLSKLRGFTLDEIAADFYKKNTTERLLEKIIMRAIDINQHFILELGDGFEKIRGYEDTFSALVSLKVYPKEFAVKIAPSVGLRNRLVHEYDNAKEEIIYGSIKDAVSQYTKYCKYILDFLNKQK